MEEPKITPMLPAWFYRRRAAEVRRTAEGVTTRAVKARLNDLAREFDRLAKMPLRVPREWRTL